MLGALFRSLLSGRARAGEPEAAAEANRQVVRLGKLVREGRAAEARALIDGLPAAQRDDPWVRLYRIKLAAADVADEASRDALRGLLAEHADFMPALLELGNAEMRADHYPQALELLGRVAQMWPDQPPVLNNLGVCLLRSRRLAEALPVFERAIELDPAFEWPRVSLASTLLCLGDFRRGWAAYEHRPAKARVAFDRIDLPAWDGSDPAGKRLLVVGEQGLGDTLLAARFLPGLERKARAVTLACQKSLVGLLEDNKLVTAVTDGEGLAGKLDGFDAKCAMMGLPHRLGITADALPFGVSYLAPARADLERWRPRVAAMAGPRFGLVWRGSATLNNDRNRSVTLDQLLPIVEAAKGRFVNLQVDLTPGEKALWDAHGCGPDPVADIHDFRDTAALVAGLDAVVTVDTAVAHVAGAMGVKVFLLCPHFPDWRWDVGGKSSPWYPSATVFRQMPFGHWDGAVAEVARTVASMR